MKIRFAAIVLLLALYGGLASADWCTGHQIFVVHATASAAASVVCTIPTAVPTPVGGFAPQQGPAHVESVGVACGVASSTTSEAQITVAGLLGGTLTLPFDESQSAVTFMSNVLNGVSAADNKTAVVLTMPAVTSGGACYCQETYCY